MLAYVWRKTRDPETSAAAWRRRLLTASQPICSALSECRTEVHLWITLTPAASAPAGIARGCGQQSPSP
jgi:hypothetical protein